MISIHLERGKYILRTSVEFNWLRIESVVVFCDGLEEFFCSTTTGNFLSS
jgi:hypothetical protein